jgi:putative membrane protein
MVGFLIAFLITAVVTAISLMIISKIPFLGVEVDSAGKALISGIVFGILNGLLGWLGGSVILNILTLGILWLIVNTLIFGLSARIVEGFRLRNGILSAILGAIALSIVNGFLFWILGAVGLFQVS